MDGPSLHTDHYELTMVAAALESGVASQRAVFEVFARRLPPDRAYGLVAGIDRVVDAVGRFRFDGATISHLVASGVVVEGPMTDWLRDYRFRGDITGYADGEVFFPFSPVLTVEGAFAECVVLETVVLSILNHDCAVASAAARMVDAAAGRTLIEGGSRRTDPQAAVAAARAAHVAGFDTTSNLEAGRRHGLPTGGTTAHSFVLAHRTERDAFAAQRDTLGPGSTYLVDTFDLLEGIRRAVSVVGPDMGAIRIDSGDLLVGSRAARALLDELGASECRVVVSSDLDEYRIHELVAADAPIDAFLVGTSLVTGSGQPTAEMVYKLVAIEGPLGRGSVASMRAVGKLSPDKETVGGAKRVSRPLGTDGRYEAEVLSTGDGRPAATMSPQVSLVRGGAVVEASGVGDVGAARDRTRDRLARLPDADRTPYPARSPAIPTRWQDDDDTDAETALDDGRRGPT